MIVYIIVSIASGLLFGVMDGLINANPLARRLYKVYEPIVKKRLNVPAGFAIDLCYGFILAGLFVLLYPSLPGGMGIVKGIGFAFIAWFFRVVMYTASQWMMFKVLKEALIYTLIAGFFEMLVIGALYGLTLRP